MRIEVDPKAPTPPSEQIADQVRFAVAGGRLATGDKLPSVRALAAQARVNPNTVARAYRELERDGTVEARRGSGVFVSEGATELCRTGTRQVLGERLGRAVEEALAAGLSPREIEQLVAELVTDLAAHKSANGNGHQAPARNGNGQDSVQESVR